MQQLSIVQKIGIKKVCIEKNTRKHWMWDIWGNKTWCWRAFWWSSIKYFGVQKLKTVRYAKLYWYYNIMADEL